MLRAITYALTQPQTALAAVRALEGNHDPVAIEALAEVFLRPHSAPLTPIALSALLECEHPLVIDVLRVALDSPLATVRQQAIEGLSRRRVYRFADVLEQLLKQDRSWRIRCAAVRALAEYPEADSGRMMIAMDDPHWRVRHALIEVLVPLSPTGRGVRGEGFSANPDAPLTPDPSPQRGEGRKNRIEGVRDFLRARDQRDWTASAEDWTAPAWPWWDADPAVLHRNLDAIPPRERDLDAMVQLLGHEEEFLRRLAVQTLRKHASIEHIAKAVRWLDDPRHWACESVCELLDKLEEDRIPDTIEWLTSKATDAQARTRDSLACASVALDLPSAIRAKTLTLESARELLAEPERETSWHVLHAAARMCKVPLWNLEPQPAWQPPNVVDRPISTITLTPGVPPNVRYLGPDRLLVAPLGLSGHYGLPVEGFTQAIEAGINVLFWEPNYHTLATFAGRLSPSLREELHFLAGTFEATPAKIRKDVERALRTLKINQVRIFLLFWTRAWSRITDEIRHTLDQLRAEGKVQMTGLSTHNRTLAIEALNIGWNPVMVRHSAAHRGAEQHIFPLAQRLGRGLITFNNLCYGRLLKPRGDLPIPRAADCYRYAMEQPSVSLCMTAPATLEQLAENLDVLRDPHLPADRRAALLEYGAEMYREEVLFWRLVRER